MGLALALSGLAWVVPVARAGAASDDVVTNCSGSATSTGSLPAVVAAAGPGDTVSFAPDLGCSTISLTAPVALNEDLTLRGPGAGQLSVSGSGSSQVFTVAPGVTATLSGLTVENGGGTWGGVYNQGSLTVTDDVVTANNGVFGGGIADAAGAGLTVTDSTVSDNLAFHRRRGHLPDRPVARRQPDGDRQHRVGQFGGQVRRWHLRGRVGRGE